MQSEKWKKSKWRGKENMYWYGNAFSLQKKDAMLVAFSISTQRELKNLGPWKQIENLLKLILQWSNWRYGQKIKRFVAPLQTRILQFSRMYPILSSHCF